MGTHAWMWRVAGHTCPWCQGGGDEGREGLCHRSDNIRSLLIAEGSGRSWGMRTWTGALAMSVGMTCDFRREYFSDVTGRSVRLQRV